MNIYDRNGKPMSQEAFDAIPHKKRVVKRQTFILKKEPILVLTMWDGVDMSHGEASVPCPFSSAVLSESYPNMLVSVPDEKKARVSHEMMAGFVRAQGGKGGWRVPAFILRNMWRNPVSMKAAWTYVVTSALVTLIELAMLTMTAIRWNWFWSDLLTVAMLGLYIFLLKNSLQGLKEKRRERAEERRAEKERQEFENIVGPLR